MDTLSVDARVSGTEPSERRIPLMLGVLAYLAPLLAILDITVSSGGHLGDYHANEAVYLSRLYSLCLSAFGFGLLAYKGRSRLEDIFSCAIGVVAFFCSLGRSWFEACSFVRIAAFLCLFLLYAFLCSRVWRQREACVETAASRRRVLLFCVSAYGCVFSFMLYILFVYEFHYFCPLGWSLLVLMHWFMGLGWLMRGGSFGGFSGQV